MVGPLTAHYDFSSPPSFFSFLMFSCCSSSLLSVIPLQILRSVPGDVAECGCWRGGVAALATAVLKASGQLKRSAAAPLPLEAAPGPAGPAGSAAGAAGVVPGMRPEAAGRVVWLLDSFAGLPPPDLGRFPDDAAHVGDASAANAE